jgi:hypothetical protein
MTQTHSFFEVDTFLRQDTKSSKSGSPPTKLGHKLVLLIVHQNNSVQAYFDIKLTHYLRAGLFLVSAISKANIVHHRSQNDVL